MKSSCAANMNEHISVMWKTVSEACNLACDYCYYSTCEGKPGRIERIDSEILERFIMQYMDISKGISSFAWQGGEPLLAGIDFFEEVVTLQAKYAPANTLISNSLQTNGTLINDRWATFFKRYRFLIGVSVDGPKEIHDKRRVTSRGDGSFNRVMNGISSLLKHHVEFNILSVIHKGNVRKARQLFDFYKSEQFHFIQFIPCMSFQSQHASQPGVYEITPQEYGDFLCEAFDCWYNNGHPFISERFFDNMLSVYARREAELCVHRKTCAKTIILEQNGDAFPCDFYIDSNWKIGNVGSDLLTDILNDPLYDKFLSLKQKLPDKCKACPWLDLCFGGCPRNRRWNNDFQESSPDYFCSSYQQVYEYAHERMMKLSDKVRGNLFQQGVELYYKGKQPGRNEPCACGSGRKYKYCCST